MHELSQRRSSQRRGERENRNDSECGAVHSAKR
jgi:hypothetical protein